MATASSAVTVVQMRRSSLVPEMWEDTPRELGLSECKEAALSLAHAFATDDLSQYTLNSEDMAKASAEEKWKIHVDSMMYMTVATCLNGVVMSIGPDYEGVALWLSPGGKLDDWWTILRSGVWKLYFQLSAEGWKRYYHEIVPLLHETKAAVLGERDDDAWYLLYLGTKPNARRQGYAKKLLEHMIQRADAEKRPIYLESSSIANNEYYRKFGFEAKKEVFLKRGATPVQLTIMVREALPARKAAHPAPAKFQIGTMKGH